MRRFAPGFVLALLLLAGLLVKVDIGRLGSALRNVTLLPIGGALVLLVSSMILKAWRWQLAIASTSGHRPHRVISASFVGFAANMVLPARLGEVARVAVLSRHAPVSRVLTLTSAGIGQILDLTMLVLLLGLLGIWGGHKGLIAPAVAATAVCLTLAILGAMVAIYVHQERIRSLVRLAAPRLPPKIGLHLASYVENITRALGVLQDLRVLTVMVAYTLFVWAVETAAMALALSGFRIDASFETVLLLMTGLNLAFVLPITPGNLGTHQLVSVLVLGTAGVSGAQAVAFSIGLQGSLVAVTLALGLFCLSREGIGVATLRREISSQTPSPTQVQSPRTEPSTGPRPRVVGGSVSHHD